MPNRDKSNLDFCIAAFEAAWHQGDQPNPAEFLPADLPVGQRQDWICELVAIDLEFRWRKGIKYRREDSPHLLDDYMSLFPEIGPTAEWPVDLIGEEYRVRHRFGDRPKHDEYQTRFPHRVDEVTAHLRKIDEELRREMAGTPELTLNRTNPPTGLDPNAPLSYSDYKLQKLIGAGRVGRVYRAWQLSLDRAVAVKYLRKAFQHDRDAIARFLMEARVIAGLPHEHIVNVHGLGRTPFGGYFLVMELIEGRDLADILRDRSRIEVSTALNWVRQAALGIAKAHEKEIVHCDLKPGNLLLDEGGKIHVTDFGMARKLTEHQIDYGRMEGTAPFMAPEQVSPYWGKIGTHTDIYGLGAVLYTLITGSPPARGRTVSDVLSWVLSRVPVNSINQSKPLAPRAVDAICQKCLAKRPTDRFPAVDAFLWEIDRALRDIGTRAWP